LPEWKKFWNDRGFAEEMKTKGIVDKAIPDAVNKIFHTGRYFLIVANYSNMSVEYIKDADQMLGFSNEEIVHGKIEFLTSLLHPEDAGKVFGLSVHYQKFLDIQPANKRLDFKASINFRIRTAQGEYMKVLEQVVGLHLDPEGRITHALKYFTDISHMRYSDDVVFSILDDKHEQGQRFYTFNLETKKVPNANADEQTTLSDREKEIISMIGLGQSSKEIASNLGISIYTVNKHRENMLRKTGSKSINEVISFAFCNGYL
jgi:DNA-binding CsgD family transcriptional regulator